MQCFADCDSYSHTLMRVPPWASTTACSFISWPPLCKVRMQDTSCHLTSLFAVGFYMNTNWPREGAPCKYKKILIALNKQHLHILSLKCYMWNFMELQTDFVKLIMASYLFVSPTLSIGHCEWTLHYIIIFSAKAAFLDENMIICYTSNTLLAAILKAVSAARLDLHFHSIAPKKYDRLMIQWAPPSDIWLDLVVKSKADVKSIENKGSVLTEGVLLDDFLTLWRVYVSQCALTTMTMTWLCSIVISITNDIESTIPASP